MPYIHRNTVYDTLPAGVVGGWVWFLLAIYRGFWYLVVRWSNLVIVNYDLLGAQVGSGL